MTVFVEELTPTWTEINGSPAIVAKLREQYDLLPDLPDQTVAEITPYFTGAVTDSMLPVTGGAPEDVIDDLTSLSAAGQVEEPQANLDISVCWDFDLLTAAPD